MSILDKLTDDGKFAYNNMTNIDYLSYNTWYRYNNGFLEKGPHYETDVFLHIIHRDWLKYLEIKQSENEESDDKYRIIASEFLEKINYFENNETIMKIMQIFSETLSFSINHYLW